MTEANVTHFNKEALSWDSNPWVQRATTLAHKAYVDHLTPPPTLSTYNVLDLGYGTGLLSLALAPFVRSITALDAAPAVIDALASKLTHPDTPRNMHPVCTLLTDPNDPFLATDPLTKIPHPGGPRGFDLVVSHLVLHHIPHLPSLFSTIHGVLAPGGQVLVTDFEDTGPAARQFHAEHKMDGVERHGIEGGEMRRVLEEAGFVGVKVERAFKIGKPVEPAPGSGVMGPEVVFPFLICKGMKV